MGSSSLASEHVHAILQCILVPYHGLAFIRERGNTVVRVAKIMY